MRRPRRNHTAAFKAKVAVAALRGDKTLIQLAQQFDVHAHQITQWKTQLLERAKDSFETAAERSEKAGPNIKDMQAKIGQLALENDPRSSRGQAFWRSRSVVSTMRAPSDDRPQACTADGSAMPDSVAVAFFCVLPTPAGVAGRSDVDATNR